MYRGAWWYIIRRPRPSPRRRCGTCSVSGPSNASNRPRQLRPGTQAMAIWVCHSHLLLLRRLSLPLPALKASKCSAAASTRHAGHSHCYYRRSRLPFARPQRPKPLRGSFDQALRPHPSATIGVRGCRLPALKGLKPSAAASTGSFDQATQVTAICYYRGSRLPFARPQRPKTRRGSFDQALRPQPSAIGVRGCRLPALKGLKRSAAPSTRHSGHSHLLLSAFEAAVCPPSKA